MAVDFAALEGWTYADARRLEVGGPDRDRTGDLMNAIHARSQLRYWPTRGMCDPPLYGTTIIMQQCACSQRSRHSRQG